MSFRRVEGDKVDIIEQGRPQNANWTLPTLL